MTETARQIEEYENWLGDASPMAFSRLVTQCPLDYRSPRTVESARRAQAYLGTLKATLRRLES